MRTVLRSNFKLLFLTFAMLLAVPAVAAIADTFDDSLTGSSQNQTIKQNQDVTVKYFVNNTGPACDISSTNKAVFTVNTPAGVTASPTTLEFTQCGDATNNFQTVTYTSGTINTAGNGYGISWNQTSGPSIATGGANFNLKVEADTVAPTVTANTPTGQSEPRGTDATATFSEKMDPATISGSTFTLKKTSDSSSVGASVTYNATDKTATLNPTNDLAYNTEYTATVTTGAKDLAGNALAANKTWTFKTLQKAAGSVSINNIPGQGEAVFGGSFTPTYTKVGDGQASVSSLTTANCTVNSGVVNFVGAGTCTLQAAVTEGTDHLAATGAQQSFVIGKANTTTTVTCEEGPFTYTGSAHTPCSASVSGPNNLNQALTVSYTDNVNAGTVTASASYAETANYNASSDDETFTIGKANITVTADAKSKVQGQSDPPLTYQVTGKPANGAAVSGSLSRLAGEDPGTYPINQGTVDNAHNSNYNITSYSGANFTITPACSTNAKFQPPFKDDPATGLGMRNIVKAGNVVPVKLSLLDCNSSFVSGKKLEIRVFNGILNPGDVEDGSTPIIVESVSSADTTGFMRQVDGQYIYNLSTKGLTTGKDYTIAVKDVTATGSTWDTVPTRLASAVIQPKK